MKKHIVKSALLATTLLILSDCKKFGRDYDTYFFTDMENSAPLNLYIDGKNKGELPNLKTSVSPGNDTILKNALHLSLKSGRYNMEARDNQGNLKCAGTLKFRSNSLSNSNTMGAQATSSSGKTVVTKLSY